MIVPRKKLLIVEDDAIFRQRLVRAFIERGYHTLDAESVTVARALIQKYHFDYAVLDLRLEDGQGTDLLAPLRQRSSSVRAVVLTGFGSIATAVQSLKDGAVHYLSKPADADDIECALFSDDAMKQSLSMTPEVPTLARVEWEHIQRVLTECNNNISEAARKLGIHRRSLQRKLSKYPALR